MTDSEVKYLDCLDKAREAEEKGKHYEAKLWRNMLKRLTTSMNMLKEGTR
ncbi:MAG: hypothetical protein CM15mV66_030 [uncultured marine virus]|nr:MAG: hypothetical protein CM15mV66_030 [uncultured marine virus]